MASSKQRKKRQYVECPHCGCLVQKDQIILCPECGREGCTSDNMGGCMPDGQGNKCPLCQDMEQMYQGDECDE